MLVVMRDNPVPEFLSFAHVLDHWSHVAENALGCLFVVGYLKRFRVSTRLQESPELFTYFQELDEEEPNDSIDTAKWQCRQTE